MLPIDQPQNEKIPNQDGKRSLWQSRSAKNKMRELFLY